MWFKLQLFIVAVILIYLLKSKTKAFNWIVFHSSFGLLYIGCLFILLIWPFPILNGKNLKNAISWANILKRFTIFFGVTWELRNGEVLAKDQCAVIVSNHQSTLDILGVFTVWENAGKLIGLIKREILVYIWPVALAVYLGGGILLDRKNPRNAFKQLEVIRNVMVKEKAKIWIFPEGTRNYDYTKFLPFKKGAFVTAVLAQAPIIPLVFSPYVFIDRKNYTFTKSHAIIQCLEEVPTTGLTMDDVPELIERVRNLMLAAYKELYNEVETKPQINKSY